MVEEKSENEKKEILEKLAINSNEVQRLRKLRRTLYSRYLSAIKRATIIKELRQALGITQALTFSQAESAIDKCLKASGYFSRIKELELYEGGQVTWEKERIGVIDEIYWDGYVRVRFEDGQKPKTKRSSPWLIEPL